MKALVQFVCGLFNLLKDLNSHKLLKKALKSIDIKGYKKWYLLYFADAKTVENVLLEALKEKILGPPDFGMERYFIPLAKKANKTVIELEDLQLQQNALATLKRAPEFSGFKAFLRDFEEEEKLFADTVESFQTGDTVLLEQVMKRYSKRTMNYRKILLEDRNVVMVEKIKGFFEGDQTVFVLVGVMHYVGPNGILALLEREGYIIEQLYQKTPKKAM